MALIVLGDNTRFSVDTSDQTVHVSQLQGATWTDLGAIDFGVSGGTSGCIEQIVVADEDDPTTELVAYGGDPGEMVRVYENKSPNLTLSSTYYKLPTAWTVGTFLYAPYVCASDDPEYVWVSSYGVFSYLGTMLANQAQFLGAVTCTAGLTVSGGPCIVPLPTASTHAARHGSIQMLESLTTFLLFKDDPGFVAGSGWLFDSLTDQTGIDDTASTGESYDAVNDLYTNAGSGQADTWTQALDTNHPSNLNGNTHRIVIPAGDISTSGTMSRFTFEASTTGNLSVDNVAVVERSGSTAAGVTTPTEILFGGSSGFDIDANQSITSDWVDFAIDKTKDYLVIIDYSDGDAFARKVASGTVYYKAGASYDTADGSGFSSDTAIYAVNKVEVNSGYSDMVLITEDFTAAAEPTYARPAVFLEPLEAMTVNTDFKLYASRDGGVTWNQATLVLIGTYGAVLLYAADVTLTSTGTTMKWKLETLNTKRANCHALGLSWR